MMTEDRLPVFEAWPEGFDAMLALESAITSTGLAPTLIELVKVRVSQINRCRYCEHLHRTKAVRFGVTTDQLDGLAEWNSSLHFSPVERVALGLADVLTTPSGGIEDTYFDDARCHFTTSQITQLTYVIAAINAWNRLAIAGNISPPNLVEQPPVDATVVETHRCSLG